MQSVAIPYCYSQSFYNGKFILMNCAEKLLEPTIFFYLYTKSPYNSGSESPWHKRDLSALSSTLNKDYISVDNQIEKQTKNNH